jgi:hypothetical protein
MESALNKFGVTAIKQIQDLGIFSWTPPVSKAYRKLHQVSAAELRQGVNLQPTPPKVRPLSELQAQCPRTLKPIKSNDSNRNEYPYNPSYLVPLYVAVVDRGIKPADIEFVVGGSVLHTLATAKIDSGAEYWAQQVPGTRIVVVEKHQSYTVNWNDVGRRFERFVWGTGSGTTSDSQAHMERLQAMVVHGHSILVSAESDGVDENGQGVEIKSSNPKNWKTKVAFQMISNGSRSLYWGETSTKPKGIKRLQNVSKLSCEEVLDKAFCDKQTVRQLETQLKASLEKLAKASADGLFDDGRIYTLHFANNYLTLHPVSLLPTESVVHELLHDTGVKSSASDLDHATRSSTSDQKWSSEGIRTRQANNTLTDRDYEYLDSLPPEMAITYGGYLPEDFCGFGSD